MRRYQMVIDLPILDQRGPILDARPVVGLRDGLYLVYHVPAKSPSCSVLQGCKRVGGN
jgi:hypothetical protein